MSLPRHSAIDGWPSPQVQPFSFWSARRQPAAEPTPLYAFRLIASTPGASGRPVRFRENGSLGDRGALLPLGSLEDAGALLNAGSLCIDGALIYFGSLSPVGALHTRGSRDRPVRDLDLMPVAEDRHHIRLRWGRPHFDGVRDGMPMAQEKFHRPPLRPRMDVAGRQQAG